MKEELWERVVCQEVRPKAGSEGYDLSGEGIRKLVGGSGLMDLTGKDRSGREVSRLGPGLEKPSSQVVG